ncbi:MAG: hypothetical protein ETSY1_09680 [Candidatus Entotheonella factor]|uniref:Epoxide hydrolase N-terminal domain-containing protein n=1 Tax=Entotheonella factor TaxID=1429438 RepID=W4LS39_ENTF1|nr:epoxide hydrolase N-terminal domain-containing protein [Candidatus Entotheonella palauensis]ETX00849.1 MAG: hypothetical protein ETSY1_09680 [Candidatus Entotheonella factor]
MDVQPFKVEVPDAVLEDLQRRLADTRWPDEIPGADWDYGSNLGYIRELVEYWRSGFDWRAQERLINTMSHYKATVAGMGIHFIHEKGTGPNPMPLVLTHGWPGTFFEMHKIAPLLTDPGSHGGDPADAFDVGSPLNAGLRVLGFHLAAGDACVADVGHVGGTHEWAGLFTFWCTRRRLGRECDQLPGVCLSPESHWHSHHVDYPANALFGTRFYTSVRGGKDVDGAT